MYSLGCFLMHSPLSYELQYNITAFSLLNTGEMKRWITSLTQILITSCRQHCNVNCKQSRAAWMHLYSGHATEWQKCTLLRWLFRNSIEERVSYHARRFPIDNLSMHEYFFSSSIMAFMGFRNVFDMKQIIRKLCTRKLHYIRKLQNT